MLPMSWVRNARVPEKRVRCLFLDRDGVLNEQVEGGYVMEWSNFVWRPGVVAALRDIEPSGLAKVIVTNQSCIGRGLTTADRIATIMERAVGVLDIAGVGLDAWYCCPHTPADGCACRKPRTGMLLAAATDLGIDLQSSYLIGDSSTDIEAGKAAGCQTWRIQTPADFQIAIAEILEREEISAATHEVSSW